MLRPLHSLQTLLILSGVLPKRKWDPPIQIIMPRNRGVDFEMGKIYAMYQTNYKVVRLTPSRVTLQVVVGKEAEFDLTMEQQ